MIDPSDYFKEVDCKLEIGDTDEPVPAIVVLTEGGDLSVQFEEGVAFPHSDFNQAWKTIVGTREEQLDVVLKNVVASNWTNFSLSEINPQTVFISQNESFVPGKNEEVVVEFDLLCFKPQLPTSMNQIDADSKEILNKFLDDHPDNFDIPGEHTVRYLNTDEYEVTGITLVDTTDRIDIIKNQGRVVRTAKIRVRQRTRGTISYQAKQAEDIVLKILELTQLVQEVTPRYVRMKVTSIGESPTEELSTYYEKLQSGETAHVGARFDQFPSRVIELNFHEYIKQAYESYTPRVRRDLRLQQVLGYYIDARDPSRAVDGKLLSVCSAIELFALWHAREDGGVSGETAQKIKHLVNKLDVETDDLAEYLVTNPEQLETPEYFWRRARNYVVHGDPEVSWNELSNSYEASLVLLKRIIRNQLLGAENASFESFYSMEPRPSVDFED